MRKLLVGVLAVLLSGCAGHPVDCAIGIWHDDCAPGTASYEEMHQMQAKREAAADETCQKWGAKPGTDSYTQCRVALAQIDAADDRARAAAAAAFFSQHPGSVTTTCQNTLPGQMATCQSVAH